MDVAMLERTDHSKAKADKARKQGRNRTRSAVESGEKLDIRKIRYRTRSSGRKRGINARNRRNANRIQAERVDELIQIGKTDLDALRKKLRVPKTDTIAVGKTNVKGLERRTFEGQSPRVRDEAELPDLCPERDIKSPANNPLFTRHAEEVLANDFHEAVKAAGINPQYVSGVLKIHQSNPTGVCRICIQGLANNNVSPGVLKQLSLIYPNLRIEVTSEILPNVNVTGKSNFVIKKGQYIE